MGIKGTEDTVKCDDCRVWFNKHKHHCNSSGGCGVYGLGFLGAIIYYVPSCVVFTDYVYAFLKALLWPAFLIHKLFTYLGM